MRGRACALPPWPTDNGDAEKLFTEVATVAIAQQRTYGLDEITGGETSADSFILHFPRLLSGIVPSENTAAWDGRGAFRITAPVGAPVGLGIAASFVRERSIYPDLQKVTIPGPPEITTMLEPREAARAAWPTVTELIRAEIRTLIEIGARDIQLDVPQIAICTCASARDEASSCGYSACQLTPGSWVTIRNSHGHSSRLASTAITSKVGTTVCARTSPAMTAIASRRRLGRSPGTSNFMMSRIGGRSHSTATTT